MKLHFVGIIFTSNFYMDVYSKVNCIQQKVATWFNFRLLSVRISLILILTGTLLIKTGCMHP